MTRRKRAPDPADGIEIVGARANNLRDLNVILPLRAVTLVAGVSGSGKSSLLSDTLATEANGRMRRFLQVAQDHLEDADPEAFIGPVPASLHFSQGGFRASRRTTVATCSGLLGAFRELFVRYAVPWADEVGEEVPAPSPASYSAWLRHHYSGRAVIWAVPMRHVQGDGRRPVERLRRLGVSTIVVRSENDPPAVWEEGRTLAIEDFRPLDSGVRHVIEAEIARVAVANGGLLDTALERAFAAGGAVVVELLDAGDSLAALGGAHGTMLDSDRHFVHPAVKRPYAPASPALLSFNQPSSEMSGACPRCEGVGEDLGVDEERLVVHPERSMHEGALEVWTDRGYKYVNISHETIEGLTGVEGFDPNLPWRKLPAAARRLVLYGGVEVVDRDRVSGRKLGRPRPFPGFVPAILERYRRSTRTSASLAPLIREGPCPDCFGTRWSREARALRVAGYSIAALLALRFVELEALCASEGEFRQNVPSAARSLVGQIHHLATAFLAVGLGHLAGERGMLTLSEGESRRLRLAGLLHAGGRDLALLLDEPARGLHEQDLGTLVGALQELKQRHTVVLNDHRFGLAPAVDHVVELGPGAGAAGGRLVRQGPPNKVLERESGELLRIRRNVDPGQATLGLSGARLHNLQGVSCLIPLGHLVGITGVSGSGKSTFVRGILLPALRAAIPDRVVLESFSVLAGGQWDRFTGAGPVSEVVAVEQRKPESNRRSIVATFLGAAETMRRAYATHPIARELGLRARDFGLNSGSGRCATCLGLGEVEDGAGYARCPTCGGRRFEEQALAVRLGGHNIAEALDIPFSELALKPPAWAEEFAGLLLLLSDLELGYLTLGRRVDRLSGGEIQRLRIAQRLWRMRGRGVLLILDEPSAGLHPHDAIQLLRVFDRIVGEGENTVLLIEHNLQLIGACDWLIEFGPGGGPAGGRVLAQATPEDLQGLDTPTGRALKGLSSPGSSKTRAPRDQPVALSTKEALSPESARRARRWLKVLLGHDSPMPGDDSGGADLEYLSVVLDDLEPELQRPHELGELDRELAELFLVASHRSSFEAQEEALLDAWRRAPRARLWIAPGLPLVHVWGLGVPASELKLARSRIGKLGLDDERGARSISTWRATGRRFLPEHETGGRAHLVALLKDALTLGSGYVELRLPRADQPLACVKARLFDLKHGVVAPLRLSTAHLRRSHRAGRCPACLGEGHVPEVSLDLLVADPSEPPTNESFLSAEARAILRGVRRLVLVPFFRRLEAEGLWNSAVSFDELGGQARQLFLFGYWHRPGHGSFLKNTKADPQKASSWLRWDGLYFHVLEQINRSRNLPWVEAVQRSCKAQSCGICGKSGLSTSSRLVCRGGRNLHDWITSGNVSELWQALRGSAYRSERERRQRNRVVAGLELFAKRCPEAPLGAPIEDEALIREGLKTIAASLLKLPAVG